MVCVCCPEWNAKPVVDDDVSVSLDYQPVTNPTTGIGCPCRMTTAIISNEVAIWLKKYLISLANSIGCSPCLSEFVIDDKIIVGLEVELDFRPVGDQYPMI